ncbi:PaaI family thioesterase [Actinocorallia longicatena]|uniref:Acyl-coenzyme A thioesterase THEM4 n=1 Tax=Actinocorallia longicatena TaxID=111803 RepID=A0ABP6PYB5_9ACTN
MSGARAAMEGVFAGDRRELSELEIAPQAALADEVRALIEAVIHTEVPETELREAAAAVAALTERLNTARRNRPPAARLGVNGMVKALGSPVTGVLNAIAPPIDVVTLEDGSVHAEFTLTDVYEGPPTFVHGGVSALILDHVLGAAAAANGTPGMTATLDLRYRRPTPHGVPLVVTARTVRNEGRKTWADATITGPDGRVTIEATAMFIFPAT